MTKKKRPRPNPDYVHHPEGDHTVPLPGEYSHLKKHGYKAVKYGDNVFLMGPGYDMKILDEMLGKIKNQESLVIAVTGGPGTGKTYLGMALAKILDSKFKVTDTPAPPPDQDKGQIVFSREHLMYLTGPDSPLKRGQVILPDESHFGIGARGWANRDQQELTNYIAAIRSKGYVLILIVLHTEMIDKMVRDFVINYEIHVTNRGEGVVYRRWFPQFSKDVYRKRIGSIQMPLPDVRLCDRGSCLKCRFRAPVDVGERCMTIRAVYERRKEEFLNTKNRAEDKEESQEPHDKDNVIKKLIERQDMLSLNSRGTLNVWSIKNILVESGESAGRHSAYFYKKVLEDSYPELLKNIALRENPPKEYPEDSASLA